MSKPQVIETNFASLSYTVYSGDNSEVVLFFPGFGQEEAQYIKLIQALGEKYKVIVVDLFFHGGSKWLKQDEPLLVDEWKELMDSLIKKEFIEKFRMMGYSMGARFAMLTTSLYPDRVTHLTLVAPDGIMLSNWYRFAVENPLTRSLFKAVVLRNSFMLRRFAERVSKIGLLDKKIYRFSSSQLQTQEQRERVYYSWVVFRNIKVSIVKLATLLKDKNIPVDFYMGEHDRIITLKRIEPLRNLLPESRLFMLPSGHTHLVNDIARFEI